MKIDLSKIWPEWEIVESISHGAYGQVHRAVRKQDEDEAAIKIISIPQDEQEIEKKRWEFSDETIKVMYQERAKYVINEIDIMKKLRGSNNIVDILDYKLVEKESGIGFDIYIRMELLKPMAKHLSEVEADPEQGAHFSIEEEAIKIGCDICRALEACHDVTNQSKKQIIHRDIKPDNILYHANGNIYKLGDFGISKEVSEHSADQTRSIGTRNYIAPEVDKGSYDCRADIYSLGLVLFYLMNRKRLPFVNGLGQGETAVMRRLSGEKIPSPEAASEGFAQVICKACAYKPEDRYSSAKEFRLALEMLARSPAPMVTPTEEPAVAEPGAALGAFGPKKKKRPAAPWIVIALLALIAALWFGVKQLSPKDKTEAQNTEKATAVVPESNSTTEGQQTEPNTYAPEQQDGPVLGKTKDTAIALVLSNQYDIKTTDPDNSEDRWEHWYKLETTTNASNYFITFYGSDPTHAVDCWIYDGQLTEIKTDHSHDQKTDIGIHLEANTTYWVKLEGDVAVESYHFSVKEELCDAGASREQAMPIELDSELIRSIAVDGEVDWFSVTTSAEKAIYRIFLNSKVNDRPVNGDMTIALYDRDGIKQDQLTIDASKGGYFDIPLSPDMTYTIKVSAENTVPATGNYAICVSKRSYDAGIDKETAMVLTEGSRYTAKLDSSVTDWYVFTAKEAGRYIVELHNIDTGCRVDISGTKAYSSLLSLSVKNEDSTSRVFHVDAGDQIYFEVKPWGTSDAEIANGNYIISIAKEDS